MAALLGATAQPTYVHHTHVQELTRWGTVIITSLKQCNAYIYEGFTLYGKECLHTKIIIDT